MSMPYRSTRRALFGVACIALALAGCTSTAPNPPTATPGLYQSQSKPGATLDRQAAAEMVSEFRRGRGLGPVTLDPALNRMAEAQASAMARDNKLSHETSAGSLKARIAASGYRNGGMWENIGAGHDTLADAFTGWRSSPPHMKNMLQPKASRIGIAAARAPGTRYEVFWAMVLADPNDPRPEVTAAQVNRAIPPFPIGAPGGIYIPGIR
ncbi:CAP domain-containing protein [Hansschlegelia sp.]|uniref:CAP domain-containing protein n=1 Tax=Hansschlegelia sp. TaxID=2041892 RepID=UPI002CBEBEE2|nr:CAP domain-containing protein [Hansschlegelia sp.]HVI27116.1 CAP domain-containing protein [Hansschlegelia sp.]